MLSLGNCCKHSLNKQSSLHFIRRYSSAASVIDTKSITKNHKPVKSIEDKDGITEVYIVRKPKGSKKTEPVTKSKLPLSQRLQRIHDQKSWKSIPSNTHYQRVEPPTEVPVPTLAHGLDRVLFNPGVHYLKDPRTKQFNFTPFLENITQPADFDYEALQPYITSSRDNSLINMAKDHKKRYVGSTSSVGAVLSQLYFVMSNFKTLNTGCLSRAFDKEPNKFTRGSTTAASIYVRWKDGVYAVDADKSHDVDETVLSVLGKSLEKVLTLEPTDFERFLKENSSQITEEEKNQPESYAYGQLGKFLLRSQLDCYDPRLPRGTFDLKTRAAVPVRLDIRNYTDYVGYSLKRAHGLFESFEREYYDMIRSAFLKYSFQVRIGHMDGILVAYHNTRKIFGFQYISREEMDSRLFGSTKIGDSVFRNALVMLEDILDTATAKYPQQTLRLSFDTKANRHTGDARTNIFVEAVPAEDEEIKDRATENDDMDEFFQTGYEDEDRSVIDPYDKITLFELSTQSFVNGQFVSGPLEMKKPARDHWSLKYKISEVSADEDVPTRVKFRAMRQRQATVFNPKPSTKVNPMLVKYKRMSEQVLQQENKERQENQEELKFTF